MKKIKVLPIFISVILGLVMLYGCENNKTVSYLDDQKNTTSTTSATSQTQPQTDPNTNPTQTNTETDVFQGDTFEFGGGINIFNCDSSGEPTQPVNWQINIPENTEINLKIWIKIEPDKSIIDTEVPINLWLFADNNLVPFDINSGAKNEKNSVKIKPNEQTFLDFKFNATTDMKFITLVGYCFPDSIPQLGMGLYNGIISYTMVNKANSALDTPPEIMTENYVNVGSSNDNVGIGIGLKKITDSHTKSVDYQSIEDFVINSENPNLYLKFNDDAGSVHNQPLGVYYSLFVIKDGEIIPVFNGEKSVVVQTKWKELNVSSEKAFQYQIPQEFTSEEGLHIFQAAAIPCYIPNPLSQITRDVVCGYDSHGTTKIRVKVGD
jgi:hypothetical protein